jgi:hypothetical protein
MATPRKRTSGFSEKPAEEIKVEEFLDEAAQEVFEAVSQKEEPASPIPVVIESITPTEDPGPRFVEKAPEPVAPVAAPQPLQPVAPRRHPRNIPKFSRTK